MRVHEETGELRIAMALLDGLRRWRDASTTQSQLTFPGGAPSGLGLRGGGVMRHYPTLELLIALAIVCAFAIALEDRNSGQD